MHRIFEVAILSAVVVGCSEQWSPTAPVDNHASAGRSKTAQSLGSASGQQVSVTVSGKSVTAWTNFAGEISAVGEGCTATPSFQNAVETPGSGGMKTATFNLSGFDKCGSSTCLVTLTDKKNNSAHVQVTASDFSGNGADCI
jgi:hypothetical protein